MDDRKPANLDEAVEWAIGIQEHFPERLLCGSAALVLYGLLRADYEVGDIDFVAPYWDDDAEMILAQEEYELVDRLGTDHYFANDPWPHCVFVRPCVAGDVIRGVRCDRKLDTYVWVKKADAVRDKKTLAWCNRR